ncbi:hypothetical protein ATE84_2393 [Aquimarina sp. MAR_2010_214]|uniref:hypothetical protein n=1 Tax=Aquimarina sp. MAR_2010_214 TaxID=1250026 RepID=UPI000C714D79|nr:hypothetical protein [Aquimarina sp. MAR_2010_214]PKV50337.1 hypothetical protein ATE84_2393 [Aquimarina sp. MAR_2010_214]
MKTVVLLISLISLTSFTNLDTTINTKNTVSVAASSFSLVNDTKEKVTIYTGSGFVSLNKGSKTSITCNTSKEVRWAEKGKKGDVIFKITSDMCGKTIKLSKFL